MKKNKTLEEICENTVEGNEQNSSRPESRNRIIKENPKETNLEMKKKNEELKMEPLRQALPAESKT